MRVSALSVPVTDDYFPVLFPGFAAWWWRRQRRRRMMKLNKVDQEVMWSIGIEHPQGMMMSRSSNLRNIPTLVLLSGTMRDAEDS